MGVVDILSAERVALNFLQRLSGIATETRRAVDAVAGTRARITHTRKTTPGLRALERYAVRVGGGVENRGSLAEAVLWKDNHWALLDGSATLGAALAAAPAGLPVVVEVETEAQLDEALAAGARHILADNQPPERIAVWARLAGPGVAIQASGVPAQKAATAAHQIATQRGGGGGGGNPAIGHAAQIAFISALNEILLVGAAVAFAGAVLGLVLVRSQDFAHGPEPALEAAPAG